jgi:hypothetical protein
MRSMAAAGVIQAIVNKIAVAIAHARIKISLPPGKALTIRTLGDAEQSGAQSAS